MKKQSQTFNRDILIPALWRAVLKLDPRWMVRNPVMFVVEIGALLTLMLTIDPSIFGGLAASQRLQRSSHDHSVDDRDFRQLRRGGGRRKRAERRLPHCAASTRKLRSKSLASRNMGANMNSSPPAHCEKMTYFW